MTRRERERAKRAAAIWAAATLWQFDGWMPGELGADERREALARWRGRDEPGEAEPEVED
jgi:hypothetical protein